MPKLDSAQRRATQSTDYVPPKALRQRRRPLPHKKKFCIVIFLFMLTKTGVHKDKWCFYARKKNHKVSLKTEFFMIFCLRVCVTYGR